MMKKTLFTTTLILLLGAVSAEAQFDDPEFSKISRADRSDFLSRFSSISWTGQGLYNPTTIDRIPTVELRARLQTAFGDPTQTIDDLINNNFRPGKAVQFEYWFVIDDEIPLMILDLDGPFENGLVYVGASRYVDMMPQIKRVLTRLLMDDVEELASYSDFYFSPERQQWYRVEYLEGEYIRVPVDRPDQFN